MRTVAVVLEGSLAVEVTAWAETEAGWNVSTVEGPPVPQLVLAQAAVPGRATVVVIDGLATAEQVRTALQHGAVDVVSWPSERQRLHELAARAAALSTAAAGRVRGPRLLAVAGAGGGAGTSTVALAIAGLLAWAGRRVLVLGAEDLLRLAGTGRWHGPGLAEVAGLDPAGAADEVAVLSRAVPGVPRLRVLGPGPGFAHGWADTSVHGDATAEHAAGELHGLVRSWPVDVVVADRRTAVLGADLVVARPDRCLEDAGGAPVAVVGRGVVGEAGVRRLLGRDPVVWLPHCARVARAGLAGRVPSGLPGSWLRDLRPALASVLDGAAEVAA